MPFTQQYVSRTARPPELHTAASSGQLICSVLRVAVPDPFPWLPGVMNMGMLLPTGAQNAGPKMALVSAPCCFRSPSLVWLPDG